MTRPLMTSKDICRLCQITRFTIPPWVKAGLLPAPIRMGRCLRWNPDEVEAFLKAAVKATAGQPGELS